MTMTERQTDDSRIALLGTGIMGSGMARSLLRAGFRTTVWNRSPSATPALAAIGAQVAVSPEEAVRDARVVITMLPNADAVRGVMFAPAVVDAFARGVVWAQMGTIGVRETEEATTRLRKLRPDVLFVDAPVSGSKGVAETGQLLILASGPPEAHSIVTPAFSAIGRKSVWLGEAGKGSRMKLVINAYMSFVIEGLAEALDLAERLGIDQAKVGETIAGGPLDAPIGAAKLRKMATGDFAAEFPLKWALKDVDLALEAAGADPPPVLAALSAQWHAAVDAGLGAEDVSAVRLALRKRRA